MSAGFSECPREVRTELTADSLYMHVSIYSPREELSGSQKRPCHVNSESNPLYDIFKVSRRT